jgi:hypothetical protein
LAASPHVGAFVHDSASYHRFGPQTGLLRPENVAI